MPRKAFDFSPYKAEILEYRRLGWDAQEILMALRLEQSKWTLNRWLAKHSPDSKYKLIKDQALLDFVREQWCRNRTHSEILDAVNKEFRPSGGDISSRQLKVLRHHEGLLFRRRGDLTDEEWEARIAKVTSDSSRPQTAKSPTTVDSGDKEDLAAGGPSSSSPQP
ncbi:uncharacterized protein BP5553_05894 [Venustampulla echinocandica]|uniref:Uncharacterized protein n=1 Tax=Venustampulla echinocandica TaxID=2656787 RepID=A0A370TLZ4_9HELO|nr:uncharacterized protein BP5553_05894 [Venustampulla echinocandica]RDL36542.1 hypothetical protein BP5553_05894 [Venustampulla echinocandica]